MLSHGLSLVPACPEPCPEPVSGSIQELRSGIVSGSFQHPLFNSLLISTENWRKDKNETLKRVQGDNIWISPFSRNDEMDKAKIKNSNREGKE
jgi:hypothetical protein